MKAISTARKTSKEAIGYTAAVLKGAIVYITVQTAFELGLRDMTLEQVASVLLMGVAVYFCITFFKRQA